MKLYNRPIEELRIVNRARALCRHLDSMHKEPHYHRAAMSAALVYGMTPNAYSAQMLYDVLHFIATCPADTDPRDPDWIECRIDDARGGWSDAGVTAWLASHDTRHRITNDAITEASWAPDWPCNNSIIDAIWLGVAREYRTIYSAICSLFTEENI